MDSYTYDGTNGGRGSAHGHGYLGMQNGNNTNNNDADTCVIDDVGRVALL
jgi:hypothetical protein